MWSLLYSMIHLVSVVPDDKTLPSVPPLQLSIPSDYPEQSPQWDSDDQQYGKRAVASIKQISETSWGKCTGGICVISRVGDFAVAFLCILEMNHLTKSTVFRI